MLLKVLLITACLVASAWAGCNPLKRLKVRKQWAQAHGFETELEDFDRHLWKNFFERKPDAAEKFFKRVRGDNIFSPEFTAHAQRVVGGLDTAISLSDNEDTFKAALIRLNVQHADKGVDPEYREAFKKAVMETVANSVGRCFDFDAWNACMDIILVGIFG